MTGTFHAPQKFERLKQETDTKTMRLAYFSPLSPQKSGIADYSEELLPYLAQGAEIDLYVDGFKPGNKSPGKTHRWFDYQNAPEALERLRDYDAVVYHVGNDHRYHAGIYRAALAFPGIVVFHDFALSQSGPQPDSLNCRIARTAEALIVHSEWSRERLSIIAPAVPVARINMHVLPDDARMAVSPPRRNTGRGVELASFGHITAEKGIERTLRVLAALREQYQFHYTLVGQHDSFDVSEIVRASKLDDRVTLTGYVSMEEFHQRIAATDVAINLRERTVGETSASVCRIMAAGVPCVVSNVGWFAELPDDAAIKIELGEHADSSLHRQLRQLLEDASLRQRIGASARRYMLREHAIEKSAASYLHFIRDVIAQRERRRFINRVSAEIANLSINGNNELFLRGVATQIAELTPTKIFDAERSKLE